MTRIVGIFEDGQGTRAAQQLLAGAGYRPGLVAPSPDEVAAPTLLKHRGEAMFKAALRWCILGSLIVEVPTLLILFALPVDMTVRVFMGATMWKFGAAFGGWIGLIMAEEQGLDSDLAAEYESHLSSGRSVLSADVRRGDRPFARGVMVESGAVDVRDVVGTFEVKVPPARKTAPAL